MRLINFQMNLFTLGIEEEFQTIDPETRELRSHMSKLVDGGQIILQERVKAEQDLASLKSWLRRAGTCLGVNDLGV